MEFTTIARPYAEALFRVARNQDEVLAHWEVFVSNLSEIGANSEIREMVANPNVDKNQVVDIILSAAQATDNEKIRNFIEVLVENDRVTLLPEIGELFHELKNAAEQTADAKIISAFEMSESQLEELIKALEKHFKLKLDATVTIDDSLIGGVVVVVGDEVLDMSVRAKLQNMCKSLLS